MFDLIIPQHDLSLAHPESAASNYDEGCRELPVNPPSGSTSRTGNAQPKVSDQCVFVTYFYNKGASRKSEAELPWDELAQQIRTTTKPSKSELPWLKLARFGDVRTVLGCLRHDLNLFAITGIEVDYDGPPEGRLAVTMEAAIDLLERGGIRSLIYTSPSHTDADPRWRVLCPLSREHLPEERAQLVGRLNGLFGGIFAAESFTLSQSYYFGSVGNNPAHRAEIVAGTPIDLHRELDTIWIGKPATKTSHGKGGQLTGLLGSDGETELLAAIRSGADYHQACIRLLGRWAFERVSMVEARRRLLDAFEAIPEGKRDDRWRTRYADINRCVRDIYGKEALKKDQCQTPLDPPPDAKGDPPPSQDLPIIWMRDMRPRMYAGGTLIKGVFDAGGMSVVYAPSNAGKSFFALDIAFHVASGWTWRGHKIKKPGFVLYLAAEGGQGFVNRVEAIKLHYDLPLDADIPLAVMPAGFNLLEADTGDGDRIIKLVKDAVQECGQKVVLIVIDTLSRAMAGGDENAPRDMTAVIRNIDRIRENVSAHVMIIHIHHTGKDVARGARGHTSLQAATDTEIEIVRTGKGEDKSAVASVRKQRDMAGGDSFPFTLKSIHFGFDEDGDPVTSAVIDTLDGLERSGPPSPKPSGQSVLALEALHSVLRTKGTRIHPPQIRYRLPRTSGGRRFTLNCLTPNKKQSRRHSAGHWRVYSKKTQWE